MTGPSSSELAVRIDLRAAWPAARDQGGRPACLACASSDAHSYSRDFNQPLSAEFLFFHATQLMPTPAKARGLTFTAADQALRQQGQPTESEWRYSHTQPVPWAPPTVSQRWYGALSPGVPDKSAVIKVLEKKQPVVLGLKLTAAFLAPSRAPHIIPASGSGYGGHAVLAVGFGHHVQFGELILIRNSWGPRWGDMGHAWLCANYLDDKLIGSRLLNPMPAP